MAQRSMVASMYEGKSLTFALGVTVSTAALSKTIARSSMAIIAARSGGDVPLSLSFTLLPCLFSVIAGAVYGYIWASCGGSPETSTPLVLPSVGRSIAAAHLHSCRSPREELLDAIVRNLPVHKRQSSGQPSEEEDGDEETPLLQPAGSDPNPRGGAATAGGALSKSYGGYGSVQSSSHGRENSMCEEPERESAFEKACPDTYQRGVMLVLALVLLHGLIVNAFHLFAQFAVPILKRRNGFSIRVAGLVSSLATCMPVVGAPITGLVLDQFMGRVTMETVCFMCTAMTATFAVLYMMPSLSPLPIMITFSAVEAVLPTAVMALLPMGVALASPDAYASPAEQASRSSGCWGRQNVNMHWAYAAVEVVDAGIAMVGSIGMGGILEKTEKFGVGAAALLSVSACAALLSYAVWGASPTIESALQPEEYELLTPRQAKPRHDDHSRPALRATELHV
uniref:Uncharacterized protein n=1 Tax=Phaeomonas parva TaxID=124430 RepID=A0A7S1XVN6_9STRA